MKKRLASLFLLLMLAGSTFAGVPLHFGDGECSMHGMMDCCKAALMANDSPEIAAAKLLRCGLPNKWFHFIQGCTSESACVGTGSDLHGAPSTVDDCWRVVLAK